VSLSVAGSFLSRPVSLWAVSSKRACAGCCVVAGGMVLQIGAGKESGAWVFGGWEHRLGPQVQRV